MIPEAIMHTYILTAVYATLRREFHPIKTPIEMEINTYECTVGGRKKTLTLCGENHDYNPTESSIMTRLLDEHTGKDAKALSEVGNDGLVGKLSPLHTAFAITYSTLAAIGRLYSVQDRTGKDINELARERKITVKKMNHDAHLEAATPGAEWIALGAGLSSILLGPLIAIVYSITPPASPEDVEKTKVAEVMNKYLLGSRDVSMASDIAAALKNQATEKVLVSVGKSHIPGIEKDLLSKIDMKRVTSPYDNLEQLAKTITTTVPGR